MYFVRAFLYNYKFFCHWRVLSFTAGHAVGVKRMLSGFASCIILPFSPLTLFWFPLISTKRQVMKMWPKPNCKLNSGDPKGRTHDNLKIPKKPAKTNRESKNPPQVSGDDTVTILWVKKFLCALLKVAENINLSKFLFCFVLKIFTYFSAFSSSEQSFGELLLVFSLSWGLLLCSALPSPVSHQLPWHFYIEPVCFQCSSREHTFWVDTGRNECLFFLLSCADLCMYICKCVTVFCVSLMLLSIYIGWCNCEVLYPSGLFPSLLCSRPVESDTILFWISDNLRSKLISSHYLT